MASFCEKCGFPQSPSSAFCPQCGSRRSASAPMPGQQGPQPLPPPPAGPVLPPAATGSGLKIVLVVLACFAVAGMAAIGGLYYVGHKVKQAVMEKASENGVDLSSLAPPPSHSRPAKRFHSPCDLLSKEDAAQLIGEPIEKAVVQDQACMYIGPKGLAAKLAQENATSTIKRAEAPGAKVNSMDIATAVDQALNSVAAEAGTTGVDGEMPLLMLSIDPDGKPAMVAMTAGKALFTGILNASENSDGKGKSRDTTIGGFGAEIPGLGDRAVRLPKIGLHVLKGDAVLGVLIGAVPDADAKSIAVARAILPKM